MTARGGRGLRFRRGLVYSLNDVLGGSAPGSAVAPGGFPGVSETGNGFAMEKKPTGHIPLPVGIAVAVQLLSAVLSGVDLGFNAASNAAGSSGIIVGLALPLGFGFWVAAPIALSIGALAGYGWTRWALLAFTVLAAALSLG